ncbi:unnamed protein product [Urochloa decumbens]|uniref:No apical meristem-associated C-terminal domain-containing protein n=1 Tax=Urochloa decumbens TaxID=240449 RepID=A0ABC8X7F0_9POAL
MAGSAPLGDGGPAWGTGRDGTRPPPPRLAGPPLPCSISGDGRPPRPAAPTSTSKKRRSSFVAPTGPAAPRPGGGLPRQGLGGGLHPGGVRPRNVPDAALAPGAFVPRQLFDAPPPGPRLPSPPRHEAPVYRPLHHGSVFTGVGRKAPTPSFSEPAHLPSHQVQKTSMEAASTASDTRSTASTTSIQDNGNYFSSYSMPFSELSPTPTAENTLQNPMGSSSQSYVAMLTQDSEADLQVLTQAPIPFVSDSGSSKGRGGNYNHNEDIQLCWSWMAITFDPRIGSDQSKDTYWNRIAQHYHVNKTFDSGRNATSLEKRWNGIQRECVWFQECVEKIERLRPSGVPHTEYINLAQKSYDETKGFPYIHCWTEVRHTEKFQNVYEAMMQAQGKRQSKAKESGNASLSQQEAHEDECAPSERPPGRKQSKQKQKRNDGEDEYALQLATFIQMKAEEQKKCEERWKAEKELEERKLLWDQEQKIMFCDMSNMDESQRAYVKAMRLQIAAAKVASVKASGGASTSEQGSGGDAEEVESLM